jgi:glycogen(starch) synthase
MRILYQCNGFLPSTIGGAEVLSFHLMKALSRRGHEVLVVTEGAKSNALGPQTFQGLYVVRLDFKVAMASRSLAALRRTNGTVAELVNSFRPDVLHLNDTGPGSLFFLRGGATASVPRILTFHSLIRSPDDLGLQARLAMDVDQIIMVSQANRDAAAAAMPGMRHKMSIILNALPMPALPPAELPFAPPVLLCIGRLGREKGMDIAIRAFAHLCERGIGAKLRIAGDGVERTSLEQLAQDLGVATDVEFIGWVIPERVLELINKATVLLIPSRCPEPFGLVALEGAQLGRPVIASAVGGLPEIVVHEQTGLLFERKNEQALADALQRLLRDPGLARRMGENAHRRAGEKFDFGAFIDAYEAAYAEVREATAGRPCASDMVA